MKTDNKPSLASRGYAFLAGLLGSGASMDAAEKAQLEQAQAALAVKGDAGVVAAAAAAASAEPSAEDRLAAAQTAAATQIAALQETIANMEGTITGLQSTITGLQATVVEQKAKAETLTGEALEASLVARVEAMRSDFRLSPHEADGWKQMAKDNPTALSAALPNLEKRQPIPGLAGYAGGKAGTDAQDVEAALATDGAGVAERMQSLVAEYQLKNPQASYSEAFGAVCKANPDLARQYRETR